MSMLLPAVISNDSENNGQPNHKSMHTHAHTTLSPFFTQVHDMWTKENRGRCNQRSEDAVAEVGGYIAGECFDVAHLRY